MHVIFPVSQIESTASPDGGSAVTLPELSCNKVK